MKKAFAVILILVVLALAAPVKTLTAAALPAESAGLSVDAECVYPGMDKSIADGFVPFVKRNEARFILPVAGAADLIHITVKFPADGPFLSDEMSFDAEKDTYEVKLPTGETETREAFLIDLSVPVGRERVNGIYAVRFIAEYEAASGRTERQIFTVHAEIKDGRTTPENEGAQRPRLIAEYHELDPETASGGDRVSISVTAANIGNTEARSVVINAVSLDGELSLLSDLNGVYTERLGANESEDVSFDFSVSKTAVSGEHRIMISMLYEDGSGTVYESSAEYRLNVYQPVELELDTVKLPETTTAGESFTLPICVINPSYAAAYNVRGVLNVNGLMATSVYFGDVGAQGTAEKELKVFVLPLGSDKESELLIGSFEIRYRDADGNEHQIFQSVSAKAIRPEEPRDLDAEAEAAERAKLKTMSQWWISVILLAAVIITLISLILAARFARLLRIKR